MVASEPVAGEAKIIRLVRKAAVPADLEPSVTLTWEQRTRSRLRVELDDGRTAGILLPRGSSLRDGDGLESEEGLRVRVRAAPETLSRVESTDALLLARVCYHLGNRHVALQIEPGRLSYLHDHVLDDLVRGLGLAVRVQSAPFEPEPGAYGGSAQGHEHGAGHHHDH
jgi:urease accessory protein